MLDIAIRLVCGLKLIGHTHLPNNLDTLLFGLRDQFPELHFSDLATGMKCCELPDILIWAARAQLITPCFDGNPEILISSLIADKLLKGQAKGVCDGSS
jgi:hypothetical protein